MTICIIKTKSGKFAANDRNLGLASSWTSDMASAMRIDKPAADVLLKGLNSLIPGHASLVEIETESPACAHAHRSS